MNDRSTARDAGLDGPVFITEAIWVGRAVRFALRAIRRRRRLAALVFLSTVVGSLVFLQVVPKMYRVETRILTFQNLMLPALISPRRSIPQGADNPTRGAVELLKSRQSVLAIVDDANLRETWAASRGVVGNAKDRIREIVFGPMSEEDFRVALLEIVDDRLIVYVEGDVLVIRVEWHHAATATKIAEAANRRFLDMKREADLAEVRETLSILEAKVAETQAEVDGARDALELVSKRSSGGGYVPMKTIQVKRAATPEDPFVVAKRESLQRELDGTERELARVESNYDRRAEEARQTLAKLRESLGANHPDIREAVRIVEERASPSTELVELRRKANEQKRELARLASSTAPGVAESVETIQVPDRAAMAASASSREINPELTTAEEALRDRILRHNDAFSRLEMARTELVTARAAFNYRYLVTQPPVLPQRHVKPKSPVVVLGGFLGGLFLALLFAVAADLLSRRVVEAWQIEVEAGIPVLGLVRVDDRRVARGANG